MAAGDPANRRRILKGGKRAAHLRGRARSLDEAERTTLERQNDFLKAFIELRGMIALSCKQAKIPRRTFYSWLEGKSPNNKKFQIKYDDAREEVKDLIELRGIARRADEGDHRAAEKWMGANAPERGYGVRRTELSGPNGGPMQVDSPTLEEVAEKCDLKNLSSILSRVQRSLDDREESDD